MAVADAAFGRFAPVRRNPYPFIWLGIFVAGMVVGFGVDIPSFLARRPPPPLIVHVHALVFTAWLGIFSTQILLVEFGRRDLHRKLGPVAGAYALLMVALAPLTALAVQAQTLGTPHFDPAFLALNFGDTLGFATFTALGLAFRARPGVHRRLMLLAAVSISDPGFARLSTAFLPHPTGPVDMFVQFFWGTFVLLGALLAWDFGRERRAHPATLSGGAAVIALQVAIVGLYFWPPVRDVAGAVVRAAAS